MGNLLRLEQGTALSDWVALQESCAWCSRCHAWLPPRWLCAPSHREEAKAGMGRGFLLSPDGLKGSTINKLPLPALWPVQ